MIDAGRFSSLLAAAALATAGTVGAATASTTLNLISGSEALNDPIATVTCSIFCQGWTGTGWTQNNPGNPTIGSWATVGWSFDEAEGSSGSPSNATIALKLSEATGDDITAADLTKLENGPDYNNDITSFYIDTDYFWVFDASFLFLFRTFVDDGVPSENPGLQTFSFDKKSGTGPSNVGATGTIQPVPLPAAGWLMLGLFGVGAAAARRKRKQKQTA